VSDDQAQQISKPLFKRSEGVTPSERYLKNLCDKTFLSLWSYPGVYRDQGQTQSQKLGKEVCDLLVVFEEHIIIFSDKDCEFPNTGNITLDWRRWFRRAIEASAQQLWGAERWIRGFPNRLFIDPYCQQKLPIQLPNLTEAKFHRVIVSHGANESCKKEYGGSGSFMIDSSLQGEEHYNENLVNFRPFTIGNVTPDKGYIHVFDDTTLSIILETLDTISDFVEYLKKKEKLLTSKQIRVFAAGEEDILAFYLQKLNKEKEHDFVIPPKMNAIFLEEGFWVDFCHGEERLSQVQANQISYAWDALIETFAQHIIEGTQYYTSASNLQESETSLRFMARESRTRRRLLAGSLLDLIEKTPKNVRATRVMLPSKPGDPHYVFLLLPHLESVPEPEYREVRLSLLNAYCLVTKLRFPKALDIVGIATETGQEHYRSEDAVYFDGRSWNEGLRAEAVSLQNDLGILTNTTLFHDTVLDYPSERRKLEKGPYKRSKFVMKGNLRNSPCICGSGRKFKHCCGKS
jgi:hypothetical protein